MDKPFSMKYEEFKSNLANLINNCGLPPFMIEVVLQNYYVEINNIAKNQYMADKTQYEQSLLENKKNDKKINED